MPFNLEEAEAVYKELYQYVATYECNVIKAMLDEIKRLRNALDDAEMEHKVRDEYSHE